MIEKSEDVEQKLSNMKQEVDIVRRMAKIEHKIIIMSGKGGVGKSTMAVNIGLYLSKKGYRTGILDVDIHGPNIPRILKVEEERLNVNEEGILPINVGENLKIFSIQFFLPSADAPVIWRGPKKTGAIRQFLSDVSWGELDVLVVDCPPGTGDEHLTILQSIPSIDGIIMVTTPHCISLDDVEKSINMAKLLKIRILGIIENLSGLVCPECGTQISIFGNGGGNRIASKTGIPLLGIVPIYATSNAKENVFLTQNTESEFSDKIRGIVNKIEDLVLKKEE